jgi:TetR/AcrR family transcriptional repressor of lmrAB and yxaGH operons
MAGDTRQRMVIGAARLLAQRGLQETSFTEVLELTGAPRGSIYHHFPGGKDQLVGDAVALAGAHAIAVMEATRGQSATEVTKRFLALWRELLIKSDFSAGCSVLAVTVATDSAELRTQAANVFSSWRQHLAELLHAGGLRKRDAQSFAALLIAGSEGAVVLSRAEQSIEPFTLVARQLTSQIEALSADPGNFKRS